MNFIAVYTSVRFFKYDAQIALDEGEVTEETLMVAFPNTAVLYLRTYKNTLDKMKYMIPASPPVYRAEY